jgi:putative membrane protein
MDEGLSWWSFPFMWPWMFAVWSVFIAIGIYVYKDAVKRGMNGLLWLILVIIPLIGIIFLFIYLANREENTKWYTSQSGTTAILEERYAKGEITGEDYNRIKRDLAEGG